MSYENPIGLLVTQIHCAGLEGTELFEAACSFLHTSRSVRSGADSIFSTILGHRVAFFWGSHQIMCFYGGNLTQVLLFFQTYMLMQLLV